ncbi:hypothetical protein SAMN04515695_5327 [Pseudovibrio sp. Tun.PSC04-5.I4]|nr:hypothetical protein SAMN04515695_5327 [Pseudovibrio sp. Tun.PSC04-5.I4]
MTANTMEHAVPKITLLPLESGPVAHLAMPVQDLAAGDSWMFLVWRRLRHGRSWSAIPSQQTGLHKATSSFSEQ